MATVLLGYPDAIALVGVAVCAAFTLCVMDLGRWPWDDPRDFPDED